MPTAAALADGTYRIAIPQLAESSELPATELTVSIDSRLSMPRHLSLQNGRDGYASFRWQLHECGPAGGPRRNVALSGRQHGSGHGVARG